MLHKIFPESLVILYIDYFKKVCYNIDTEMKERNTKMITIPYKKCLIISLGALERKTRKDFDWVYERFLLADGNAFSWVVEFNPDMEDEEDYLLEDKPLTEALHEVGFPLGSTVWISVSC